MVRRYPICAVLAASVRAVSADPARPVSGPARVGTEGIARVDAEARVIAGYRLREIIGRGGSSLVYRALNDCFPSLPRVVALKVAIAQRCTDPEFRRQFHEQSRVAAVVDHPSVLPVVDAGEVRGRPYLVMPHIDGADLSRQLTAQAMTVGRVLVLLRQVAEGLDAMHRAGVLHLDVKPANVLVGRIQGEPVLEDGRQLGRRAPREPRAFLTDLGLCRFLADEPGRPAVGPRGVDFVGSPRYASPEHLRGRAVLPAADVYSLTCVLFACLAGRPPYVGEVPAVVTGHFSGRVPSLSALTGLPRALDRVIRRGMHPDRGSRFASCSELITQARLAIIDGP
jgi:serine/threonine protein kinase